jgi:O-antigen/teichoic acid export membrane protein
MGWLLGPGDYGLLAFVQTLVLMGVMVVNSALAVSLTRAVAKADGARERDALVRGTLVANLILAVAMSAILLALFAAGPLREGFELWSVVAIVALFFPLGSLLQTATGCFDGSQRFGASASIDLTEASCKMLSGIALVLLGFGASGAIAGFLVGAVCAVALGFYRLAYGIGVRLRGSLLKVPDLRATAAILGTAIGLSLLLNIDIAGFKLLADERAFVGFYQAGVVLSNAPYFLVLAAMTPVLFVQLARYDSVSAGEKTLGETLSLTAALILPIEIVLMVFPRQALGTFFPDVYAPGAPALRILAIANVLLILALIFAVAFQAVGRAKIPALILLPVALAEPFALWAVVPSGQALGAAWVFVAAAFLALSCLAATYLWEAGTASLWRVALWIGRYVLAVGAGLAAGRLALELGVAAALVAGGTCYLVIAILLRLVRPVAMFSGETSLGKLLSSGKE